jgi:hypothetical protein
VIGMENIDQAANRVILDWLPARLKAAIDEVLARGGSKPGVLSVVEASARRAAGSDRNAGKLTVEAVKAYLETK